MPLMNVFEPLFLLLVVVTLGTLAAAASWAMRGNFARAGRMLRRLGIGAALYFAVAITVSIVSPRRTYHVGDNQCFDDWCIAVVDAQRTELPQAIQYDVRLRLSNRARRVPMGEKGTVVYLVDRQGRRYDPLPDPTDVPVAAMLQPGQSLDATRRFDVARDAQDVGLIYTHEGGFPIGWLIIGEGGWFGQPPIVRLH
jgi:hypothetical protein